MSPAPLDGVRRSEADWRTLSQRLAGLNPLERLAALRHDQQQSWQNGQRIPAEEYLRHLPDLAADPDDNVAEAAIDGLARGTFADVTEVYLAALKRTGYQVVRAAARAIEQMPGDAESPRVGDALAVDHDHVGHGFQPGEGVEQGGGLAEA